jgi:predicted metal-dependent hydrolase
MQENKLHSIPYGSQELCFFLQHTERTTLAIHVHPDMSIEVVAPFNATLEKIYEKVRKNARWIIRQICFFKQFHPKQSERIYISGETHRYLGRQYRLKIMKSAENIVSLSGGFILVKSIHPENNEITKKLVQDWFKSRAKDRLHARLKIAIQRFPDPSIVTPKSVIIRSLESRWGSMSPAGNLLLNWRLIHASNQCIDYVITHELCHRIVPHHGRTFWELLAKVYPDWKKYKNKLETELC